VLGLSRVQCNQSEMGQYLTIRRKHLKKTLKRGEYMSCTFHPHMKTILCFMAARYKFSVIYTYSFVYWNRTFLRSFWAEL